MKRLVEFAGLLSSILLISMGVAVAAELEVKFSGTQHQALFDIDFNGDIGLAVGGAGFMLRSEDGGKTWKRRGLQGVEKAVLGVDVGPQTTLLVGQGGLILHSKPQGGWKQVSSPTDARLFAVDANETGLAVAVGEFGQVLISKDGGRNWLVHPMPWRDLNDQGLEPHLYVVHVDKYGSITLAGEFESIIRSTDGGESWVRLHTGDATIFDLEVLEDGTGYAVGQDGLFLKTVPAPVLAAAESETLSDAQGEAADRETGERQEVLWQRIDLGSEANLLGVAANASGEIFISGMRQFWHSKDAGQNWQPVTGQNIHRMWYQSVTRNADGQFYAVGKRGTLGLLNH